MPLSLASCARKRETDKNVLKVAVLESAYGSEMWRQVAKAFEEENEGVTVKLTAEKNLEDVISAKMKSGDYPDFVHLATGREAALTETLIKGNALEDISDVFEMTVPGENVKVSEKLTDGFTSTLATNPYSNSKTYLAPMFYSPCGLFYNAGLFRERGWDVPETWEEMWELGDKAKKEGIYLFTYPTAGYFDSLVFALLAEVGGIDFYNDCMNYKKDIWESDDADEFFEIMESSFPIRSLLRLQMQTMTIILKTSSLYWTTRLSSCPTEHGWWERCRTRPAPRALSGDFVLFLPQRMRIAFPIPSSSRAGYPRKAKTRTLQKNSALFFIPIRPQGYLQAREQFSH